MTRKDYILVAGVLAEAYRNTVHEMNFDGSKGYALNGIGCAATSLANAFAADNSRFDRDHFLAVVRGEKSLTSRPTKDKFCPECAYNHFHSQTCSRRKS